MINISITEEKKIVLIHDQIICKRYEKHYEVSEHIFKCTSRDQFDRKIFQTYFLGAGKA